VPRPPILVAALFPAAFLAATPVLAQDAGAQNSGERVNQLIVYGNDPCPPSAAGEITVCARKEEEERYRIPEPLRDVQSPQNEAWNNRVVAYETVGSAGTLSCSPVGAGGSSGCTQKLIDAAFAEKRGGEDATFSKLIAEERAKRLSTLDAEAAETQKRVEEAEKQYEERQKRETQGGEAKEQAGTGPASQ
jgi:hypothetical protein